MKRIAVIGLTGLALLAASVVEAPAQQPHSGAAALLLAALAAAPSGPGAFESLSTAHQKTARALYEAQRWNPSARLKLTLEQIAARRQSGQGWGEIFNTMKARGLVRERRIGELLVSDARAGRDDTTK
jgi:hypothetical protein